MSPAPQPQGDWRARLAQWPLGARLLATVAAAAAAGALCTALRVPLPWMLGPLFGTAGLAVAGVPVAGSNRLRNLGQWMIGLGLGLYFTPTVVARLASMAPWMLVGVLWSLLLGYGFYRWLLRVNPDMHTDRAGAFFGAAIGGASEMSLLAERQGGSVARVAAAHSLRVLIVVSTIPIAFQWLGLHGTDSFPAAGGPVRLWPLMAMLAVSAAGMALLDRLRMPNPWVLGALLATAAWTALGAPTSALPGWASKLGQCLIGVSLGTRFSAEFARDAPRWLATVAAGTVGMIVASAAFGVVLASLAGLDGATVTLGTSPGGIAEMCLTAQVLHLGVPVVTVLQVTRYVGVLLLTGHVFQWEQRRWAARAGGGTGGSSSGKSCAGSSGAGRDGAGRVAADADPSD